VGHPTNRKQEDYFLELLQRHKETHEVTVIPLSVTFYHLEMLTLCLLHQSNAVVFIVYGRGCHRLQVRLSIEFQNRIYN
jgi:hypothetical protein